MDRVFENAGRSSAAPLHTHQSTPAQQTPTATQPEPIEVEVREARWPRRLKPWPLAGAGLACMGLLGGLGLWHGWSEARNDLRQERNLRLLEGIRSLGTAPNGSGTNPATGCRHHRRVSPGSRTSASWRGAPPPRWHRCRFP
jgi:hypothetical protein